MKKTRILPTMMAAALLPAVAQAQLRITEVHPTGSGATYSADWFEVLNSGPLAIDLTGWKMDDSSAAFASAVSLRGITSINAGQTVIFLEGNATGTTDSAIASNFQTAWFGANVPAGLTLAFYGGSGVGLSSSSDGVNLYDSSGTLMAGVSFGAATAGTTFDNSAGLNNTTISQLSVNGVNGAFTSDNGLEVGSPGIAAVPEPSVFSFLFAGAFAFVLKRRK